MGPTLGYWALRGVVSPIKMLLHHVDEKFEDKQYGLNDFDSWFKVDKPGFTNTLDFPNLPYLLDGDVKITQTKVILAFLGRKHNLDGTNETERIRMGLGMEVLEEYRQDLRKIGFIPNSVKNRDEVHETLRKEYEEQVSSKLAAVSKFLGSNKYVAGDRLTYVDFFVYDILDFHRILFNLKYFEAHSNLCAYMKRIEDLPGMKKFMASPSYSRTPIYPPSRMWGNTKDWKPTA